MRCSTAGSSVRCRTIPAALADITIYVPTRRATRALIALLAERGGAKAQLLPRIVPLGEADEAEFELTGLEGTPLEEAASPQAADPAAGAPPDPHAPDPALVGAGGPHACCSSVPMCPFLVPGSPADAVNLAADLETLMDSFTTEGIDWHALELAVDADFSEYFRITRNFVQIVSEILAADSGRAPGERSGGAARRADRGRSAASRRAMRPDHADDRRRLDRLDSRHREPHRARSRACRKGAVVLPGLDTDLDEESWRKIGGARRRRHRSGAHAIRRRRCGGWSTTICASRAPTSSCSDSRQRRRGAHPRSLRGAAPGRDDRSLVAKSPPTSVCRSRRSGCDGIAVVEATDEREEALAIAVALRETLNDPAPERGPRHARSGACGTGFGGTGALGHRRRGFGRLRALGYAGGTSGAARRGSCRRGPAAAAGPGASRPSAGAPRLAARDRGACRVACSKSACCAGPRPAKASRECARRWPTIAATRAAARRARDKRLTEADWDLADELLRRLETPSRHFRPPSHGEGALDLIALTEHHRRSRRSALGAVRDDDAGERRRSLRRGA